MKLLVTGSGGFIGKNLCSRLRSRPFSEPLEYDKDTDPGLLDRYTAECGFVFHLAGINRPGDPKGFEDNHIFTGELLQSLKKHGNCAPVLMSSSIQAELDSPYGRSKKKAEELLFRYEAETGARVFVYRLPNVFGKWCRPNYNNVVATFCSAVANGRPVRIDDPDAGVSLVHIDDVVREFLNALDNKAVKQDGFYRVPGVHRIKVGELAALIASFREAGNNLMIGNMGDILTNRLYSTYLSYLPEGSFSRPLAVHADARGSFAEFMKSESFGQVSINIIKPGKTKGNHWHHTKTEKMLAASGSGVIRFKKAEGGDIFLYPVSGERPEVIDIPAGYAHSVTNTGTADMVMVIWANEIFDPQNPDTYPMELNG
jgi:UDP-2-acetamido-2,6-beta-L-arabino-hexul-4-ose reductase